jgi:TPR repeat protein
MQKKILLTFGLLFGIVLFYYCLKFYTIETRNAAIEEYQSKINSEYSANFLRERKKGTPKAYMKSLLIENFDRQSYDSIVGIDSPQKAFIYSLIVANKWNNGNASFDAFHTIATLDSTNRFCEVPNLDFLDKETINLAILYLKKANHNGPVNAKFILGKYYLEGKYVEKNNKLGNELLKEADKLSNGVLK